MKPHIDFFETIKGELLGNQKLKHRFIRYWGTETINGIEVFKKKYQIYPDNNPGNTARLMKLLGMEDALEGQDMSKISSMWLYIKTNAWTPPSDFAAEVYVNKLNTLIGLNDEINFNLSFTDPNDVSKFSGMTKEDILAYVDANYDTILKSYNVMSNGGTLVSDVLGIYFLVDDNTHLEITINSAQVAPVKIASTTTTSWPGRSTTTYTYATGVEMDITVKKVSSFTEDSVLVQYLMNEDDKSRFASINAFIDADDDYDTEDIGLLNSLSDTTTTNELWYNGQLRVAVTNSYVYGKDTFLNILSEGLDYDYKVKKKGGFFSSLLSIFIVVLAFWVAGPLGTAWSTSMTLAQVALNLGIASLVMTIGSMIAGAMGYTGTMEFVGRFAQITGIASFVAGIPSMLKTLSTKLTEFMAKASTEGFFSSLGTSAVNALKSMVGTEMVTLADGAVVPASALAYDAVAAGIPTTFVWSPFKVVSIALKVVKQIADMRVDAQVDQINNLTEQNEQIKDELEDMNDKAFHIGVEDIRWYSKPLRMDNMAFEVDYLYEPTKFNIGRGSFYPVTALNLRANDLMG